MKMIFASEDCFVGILFGALILALSEKWFNLPSAKTFLIIVIPIFIIFVVLDVVWEFSDLSRHFMFIGVSILQNIFDFVLCIGFYSLFFNFSVPIISGYTSYLTNPVVLYYLGLFEIISHIVWLVLTPFNT